MRGLLTEWMNSWSIYTFCIGTYLFIFYSLQYTFIYLFNFKFTFVYLFNLNLLWIIHLVLPIYYFISLNYLFY
jgi:hypothetical protein